MKIVIDEKIPYIQKALEAMGHTVTAKAGNLISAADVKDAGALFVRTRTMCNGTLLDDSEVRFIGTATIGYDHIDAQYCKEKGIYWTSAPGCNAGGVVQYIQSAIYKWCEKQQQPADGMTLGIVGVGEIGSRVAAWAREAGMKVLLNDPPREAAGAKGFVSLNEIAQECDIITFHPTLTYDGEHASYHLADKQFFDALQRKPLFINASRGPVADNKALMVAYNSGKVKDIVMDVWENEPDIAPELLDASFIATPHIAGYSAEGKHNATRIVLERFADFTDYSEPLPIEPLPSPENPLIEEKSMGKALLSIYNPDDDTAKLKQSPELFEELRNNYCFRREPSAYQISIK